MAILANWRLIQLPLDSNEGVQRYLEAVRQADGEGLVIASDSVIVLLDGHVVSNTLMTDSRKYKHD